MESHNGIAKLCKNNKKICLKLFLKILSAEGGKRWAPSLQPSPRPCFIEIISWRLLQGTPVAPLVTMLVTQPGALVVASVAIPVSIIPVSIFVAIPFAGPARYLSRNLS